jgi:hypothetical protein
MELESLNDKNLKEKIIELDGKIREFEREKISNSSIFLSAERYKRASITNYENQQRLISYNNRINNLAQVIYVSYGDYERYQVAEEEVNNSRMLMSEIAKERDYYKFSFETNSLNLLNKENEINTKKKKIKSLQTFNQQLEKKITSCINEKNELQAEIRHKENVIADQATRIASKNGEINELKKETEDATNKQKEAEGKVSKLITETIQLQKNNGPQNFNKKITSLENELVEKNNLIQKQQNRIFYALLAVFLLFIVLITLSILFYKNKKNNDGDENK